VSASDLRRRGLLKAFSTATSVISKVAGKNSQKGILEYAPGAVCLVVFVAAIMVLKILDSSYAEFVDSESAKQSFNAALMSLRQASVETNDLPGRYAKILTQLWSLHSSIVASTNQEPELKVKTRIGASLLHDSLWQWRESFGGQLRAEQNYSGNSYNLISYSLCEWVD
jgi:transcriptional regulatory protein LEU3